VKRESTEGGLVSSMVAAGVDCLDSVLEFVKGIITENKTSSVSNKAC